MPIKHISFDFYNTLASPNPYYSKNRTELLSKISKKSPDEVVKLYRETKKIIDGITLSGFHVDFDYAMQILSNKLDLSWWNMVKMKSGMAVMFHEYPPIIHKDIIVTLQQLKNDGYSLSIGSNTHMSKGEWIRNTSLYSYANLFNFMMFSDEEMSSKPHYPFFLRILQDTAWISQENILHVGDNPKFDEAGGKNAGFKTLIVNSPLDIPTIFGNKQEFPKIS